jgi:ubiquinone biosynthesis protein UbiJ
MQRFLRDVDELREAIDRLDARLQQLTARTA